MAHRIYLEIGAKRIFACSVDWVGWARSAKRPARMPPPQAEELALEALAQYLPRYAPIAASARLELPADAGSVFSVVERVPGDMTTDFGAPGQVPSIDDEPWPDGEGDRLAALLAASWAYLDAVSAAAPPTLQKGPRGGGRDRDAVVEHVIAAEAAYVRKLGIRSGKTVPVEQWRAEVLSAFRDAGAPSVGDHRWPPRYAARRIAWHVLDHAWEIEDKS